MSMRLPLPVPGAARLLGACAAGLCLLVAAQVQAGSDNHQLSVQATVLSKNKCHFTNGGPTALNFSAIDPSSQSDYTAAATISFRCQGADAVATFGIASDDGLYETGPAAPRMLHGSLAGEYLPYQLDFPASGSVPRNTTQDLTVTGTITPGGFQNAPAGSYADTVVFTINP